MTGGVIGNNTKIAYSGSSPVSWTRVGQVFSHDVPGLTRDKADATVSSSSPYKRSGPGMISVEDMNLVLLADLDEGTSATHDALFDYLVAGTTLWWRVEVPVNDTEWTAFEFQGFVSAFKVDDPVDDHQKINLSIAYDGDSFTKYAAGASAIS